MACRASAPGQNLPLALIQLRLFPPMAVMIPVMIMWAFLDLIDTWWGLALIYGIVTLPFAFWLMKTFFDDMPREIEEAALVEGCSRWRVFTRITLPMMRAPLATAALFVFILNWSDYLIALLLTTREWVTIPVYMASLSSSMTGQLYGAKAALGLIAAVPPGDPGHRHPEAPGARPHLRGAEAMSAAADTSGAACRGTGAETAGRRPQARLPADAAGAAAGAVHLGLSAADAALHQPDRLVAARRASAGRAPGRCGTAFANYTDLLATTASGPRSGALRW